MSMRGAKRNPVRINMRLLLEALDNFLAHLKRQDAIVHRDENGRAFLVAPDGERLGKEMLDGIGRLDIAAKVAVQANGIIRRDIHLRHPDQAQGLLGFSRRTEQEKPTTRQRSYS